MVREKKVVSLIFVKKERQILYFVNLTSFLTPLPLCHLEMLPQPTGPGFKPRKGTEWKRVQCTTTTSSYPVKLFKCCV